VLVLAGELGLELGLELSCELNWGWMIGKDGVQVKEEMGSQAGTCGQVVRVVPLNATAPSKFRRDSTPT